MKSIKFSHDYEKLPLIWEGTQCVLQGLREWDIDTLKRSLPSFVRRDVTIRGGGEYDFSKAKGLYLVLFFIHINEGIVFTTIRRATPEKYSYYNKSIGETFLIQKTNDF